MRKLTIVEKWESKLFPGVTAKFQRFTYADRIRFGELIQPHLEKMRQLGAQIEQLVPTPTDIEAILEAAKTGDVDAIRKVAAFNAARQEKAGDLLNSLTLETARMDRAWAMIGLRELVLPPEVEVEGLPAEKITPADLLLCYCPSELANEVIEAIRECATLTDDESKNLSSHSTSAGSVIPAGAAVGTASAVSPPETSSTATVAESPVLQES